MPVSAFAWMAGSWWRKPGSCCLRNMAYRGPAVMKISRCVGDWERRRRGRLTVHLDLLPGWSAEQAERCFAKRRELAGRTREDYLTGFLQKRVGQTLLRAAGLGPLAPACGGAVQR